MKILTEKELNTNKERIINEVYEQQLVDVHVRINETGYLYITTTTDYTVLNVDIQSCNTWEETVDHYYDSLDDDDDKLTEEHEAAVNQLVIDITPEYVESHLECYFNHVDYVKECKKINKRNNLAWAESLENSNNIINLATSDDNCDYFFEIQHHIVEQVRTFNKSIAESITFAFRETDEAYTHLTPEFKIIAKALVIENNLK